MVPPHPLRYIGVALVSGAVVLVSVLSGYAQVAPSSGPMEITTDTPEYCQKLLHRVGNMVRLATEPVPAEVTDLTSEGQRMCDHGQTRGGIMRVRSALKIMEKSGGNSYR